MPETILVDDTAPEEIDALLSDETSPAPPIRLCDPFWDIAGATDADLVME